MDNNPSPGNKAGGLTTILEKSLGAVAKAGSTNLTEVYEYADAVTEKGFVFMDTPGYDPVSATGQVAGGANLIGLSTSLFDVCGLGKSGGSHHRKAQSDLGRERVNSDHLRSSCHLLP